MLEFQRIVVESSFSKPSFFSGHVYDITRPCRIYGLYCERSGTIILEGAWCDGESYTRKQLSNEDAERFHEELRAYITEAMS